jgi:DNA polymerase/3'-5' exonuclease PolX
MNYKAIIIDELDLLRKKEQQDGNTFKAIAYGKVIQQVKSKETITGMDDLKDVKGVGESIQKKMEEIFETGKLKVTEEVRKDPTLEEVEHFMNIYGVGRVKAVKLVREKHIHTIADLRARVAEDPNLLNTNQTVGLKYYEDLLERIPRAEMKKHEKILKKVIPYECELVGSYRREEPNSGDIDVLIRAPAGDHKQLLEKISAELIAKGYLIETLALGDKKCLAICRLPGKAKQKARRLDLLLAPEKEYGFSLMYFTGSDKFNIAVRKVALEKGYSMNEHAFTPQGDAVPPPELLSEKDIFEFLGFKYVEPVQRKSGLIIKNFLNNNRT